MRLVQTISLNKNTFLTFCFAIICISLAAQENSPYSRYGLGDLVPSGNIINRAMGGISIAYFDNQSVNFLNPASYSKLKLTTFDLGFELDNRAIREPNFPGKFNSGSANISYVQLGIPLMRSRNWGLNLGLRPNTRINYKIQEMTRLTDPLTGSMIDSAQMRNEGTGGSYEAFAGSGIAFGNFSIGFNAGYLFGTKDYSSRLILINDTVNYKPANYETKSTFGGISFNAGALYSAKLAKTTWLKLGVTAQLQREFSANRDRIIETFGYDVNGASARIDSVYVVRDAAGKLTYPSSFGAGLVLEKENEWLIGADYTSANWSNYRFFNEPDLTRNSWQFKLGGSFTPDLLRGRNYWSHVTYRAGAFYGKDYIKIGKDLSIFGLTAGAAFPIRRSNYTNQYTVVNLSLEGGVRGNNSNQIRENFFRIGLGFSLSDLWFIKKKYD